MESLRTLLRLLGMGPRRDVIALFLAMLLSSATEGVGLILVVPLLDVLAGGGTGNSVANALVQGLALLGLPAMAGGLLIAFVGLVALRGAVQLAQERLNARLQFGIVDRLRFDCFSALLNVEWRWLINTRRSDHANLLLGDINRIGVGLHYGLALTVNLIAMVAYLCVAFSLSHKVTALALLAGGIVFALLARHRRQALDLGNSQINASRALHGDVEESLAGVRIAKILGNETRHLDFLMQTAKALREVQIAFVENASLSRTLFQIGSAALLAAYVYIGAEVWKVPAAELLALALIFSRLVPMFMSGQQQLHQLIHALPAIEATERLLAECRSAAEPAASGDRETWTIREDIRIENVSLQYPGRDTPALSGLSLRLPVRTTTAILGESGAGKSTLADILMGLLEPDSGVVLIDGRPIEGAERRRWRRSVAYVPQDSFLFHDSIRRNLLWGHPEADEADLRQALEQAAAQFVFSLPKGLDTVVGDNGLRLSGGERQRIALARALLKRPSLLILDEATSALDIENEARIRSAIERLHGDLTVVIIGHRLPTMEHADQVVVIRDGRVAVQGPWSEVRKKMEATPDDRLP